VISEFSHSGISFQYPSNWRVESDLTSDNEWTVSVYSPSTAFLLFSLRSDARDPAEVADQTLDALRTEYKELDAENRVETIAGQAAIGHDIDFLTVDTAIICRTRCLETASGPLLIMAQLSEYDRSQNDPVLRAIVASLRVESE